MKNARNPKQVNPQPEKYLTKSHGWSKWVHKAMIVSKNHATMICKINFHDEDCIKPYQDGFIVTKPATP